MQSNTSLDESRDGGFQRTFYYAKNYYTIIIRVTKVSMTIKIDLIKVFDMVKWEVVLGDLKGINTPHSLVDLIDQCITSRRFLINFNSKQVCYFDSTNGLRQVDPLSFFFG